MSYVNIGGLPSGFKLYDFDTLEIRPLLVSDMQNVEYIKVFKRPLDVFLLLKNVLRLDDSRIWQLTIDDCVYILSYLRRICYTDAPITVTWDCNASVVNEIGKRLAFRPEHLHSTPEELRRIGLQRRVCERKNSELIYPHSMEYEVSSLDDFEIPAGLKIPRLLDAHLYQESYDEMGASIAMFQRHLIHIDAPTIRERLEFIGNDLEKLDQIESFADKCFHGIRVGYRLRCFDCNHSPYYSKSVDLWDALPIVDETSMMNIQYTMLVKFHTQIDENTPIKKLLFWHSAYQKDKQEAAQANKPRKGR